jgi:Arc/MetJ family transcription regulator
MLRYACGYALVNAGRGTRRVQDWLGHRSIAHTARYTQLSGNMATVGSARVSTLGQDLSSLVEHRLRVIGGTERENAIGDKREARDQYQTVNEVSA